MRFLGCCFVVAYLWIDLASRALGASGPCYPCATDSRVGLGISVADLISLSRFGSLHVGGFGRDEHVVSPDGHLVAVVVQTGNLKHNTRDFSLLVFQAAYLQTEPISDVVAQFSSSSNRPGISQVTWLSNDTLAFLGEAPESVPEVYTVNLKTKQLVQQTRSVMPITVFKSSGGVLVYAAETRKNPSSDNVLRARGFVVPHAASVVDVVTGNWKDLASDDNSSQVLHVVRDGNETKITLPDVATYGPEILS